MNQASIFTLEKSGTSYKYFDVFPRDLYVDTSAWLKAYINNAAYNPIREFMGDCVEQGTTLYHSEMVLTEIVHVNEKAFYDEYANAYIQKARCNGKVNQKRLRELIYRDHPEIADDIRESGNQLLHIIRTSSEMLEYESNADMFEEVMKIREASGNILGINDAKINFKSERSPFGMLEMMYKYAERDFFEFW